MTNEEILEAISSMSVLELSELVKAIEDKFGVSAAAPVAVAAAAAPAAAAAEEKTEFDVILKDAGDIFYCIIPKHSLRFARLFFDIN